MDYDEKGEEEVKNDKITNKIAVGLAAGAIVGGVTICGLLLNGKEPIIGPSSFFEHDEEEKHTDTTTQEENNAENLE